MKNPVLHQDIKEILEEDLPWEQFAGRTILVSGAAGFLPSYFVYSLLQLNEKYPSFNCKVIGMVRGQGSVKLRLSPLLENPNLQVVEQDVSKPFNHDGPIDFIVHGASYASPKYYAQDPAGTLLPNMLGTYQLLELARKKKSQNFLFISSGEVYGVVHHEIQAIGENDYGLVDPTKVRSCYAEGKRVGENLCVNWSHQFEVPTKIVRPFHTYGPGLKLDDGRVYADFIADIVAQRDIVLKSSGAAVRSFCYVADAIRGFFTVMLKGKNAEAYNVGNLSEAHSVAELAEALVALYPERNIKVRREARETSYLESPIPRNCPNVEKARALGWKPRYTIEEGFRKTIETYL